MRKKVMAVVFAVLAFSLIAASAATLSPINSSGVGAGTDAVAACDPNGVNVDFTVDETSPGVVVVTEVDVNGIHGNCVGEDVYVTLYDDSNTSLGTAGPQIVVDNGTNNNEVTFTGFTADPEAVTQVRVVIG